MKKLVTPRAPITGAVGACAKSAAKQRLASSVERGSMARSDVNPESSIRRVNKYRRSSGRPASELNSAADLERARATRSEHLSGAAGRLAERRGLVGRSHLVEIEAIAAQVGDVENVEHLAEQRQLPPLTVGERLGETDVLRDEVVAEGVVLGQEDGRDHLAQGVLRAGVV